MIQAKKTILKALPIVAVLALLLIAYWLLQGSEINKLIVDMDALIDKVKAMGYWGPMIIMGFMVLAIVFNPLPSAPVAMASGAVFGHIWGTLYIIIGAFIGAVIAFSIARFTSYDLVRKYLGNNQFLNKWKSQNSLMAMVFVSRLIPFISFDLVSYGAGVTPITFWRFALATLFGLIPMSFLLAHFGGEMTQANLQGMGLFLLVAGVITLIPVMYRFLKRRNQAKAIKVQE